MMGKITISVFNSTDPKRNNQFYIRIEDNDYIPLTEIVISPQNLAFALSGMACRECEIILNRSDTNERNDG